MLIDKINNPEKYNNISSNEIILKSSKKEEKKRVSIHFNVICDTIENEKKQEKQKNDYMNDLIKNAIVGFTKELKKKKKIQKIKK